MKILLCDTNKAIIDAVGEVEHAQIMCADIFQQKFDTIVTPTNSFGFMDGNFDYLVVQKYGQRVEAEIRQKIAANFDGELPIGTATFCNKRYPLIIAAPTMRVPMSIVGTINAYLAMNTAFRLAFHLNSEIVALPAMGAGCGGLSPEVFAKQFKQAVKDFYNPPIYKSWQEASAAHFKLI